MPTRITDADDTRVRDYRAMTDVGLRSTHEPEHGLFMAESAKVIRRAVSAGYRPRSFLLDPSGTPASTTCSGRPRRGAFRCSSRNRP